MLHGILVRLARLAVGEVLKKIILTIFVLSSLVFLVAFFIFNWRSFHSSMVIAIAISLLLPLMFWCFLRRYLIIHPLAGNKKYDNYFISVFSGGDQRKIGWQMSDFYWINDSLLEVAPFSIFKLVPVKPGGSLFQSIATYKLPFGDTLPPTFPSQVILQVNFSSPYRREEVLWLMIDIWKLKGFFYSSYEDYLRQFFQDFLTIKTSRLKNGFFSPDEVKAANYFKAVDHLEKFFSTNFLPSLLSNVESISYSFDLKD